MYFIITLEMAYELVLYLEGNNVYFLYSLFQIGVNQLVKRYKIEDCTLNFKQIQKMR